MIFAPKSLFFLTLSLLLNFAAVSEAIPSDQDEEKTLKTNSDEGKNLKPAFYNAMNHLSKAAADGDREMINDMIGPLRLLADRLGLDQSHCTGRIELARAVLALGPDDSVLPLFRRLYSSLFLTISQNLNARDDSLAAAFNSASDIGLDTEHLRQIRFLLFFRKEGQLRLNFFSELDKLVDLTSPSNIKRRIAIRKLNMHMNSYSLKFAKSLNVSID